MSVKKEAEPLPIYRWRKERQRKTDEIGKLRVYGLRNMVTIHSIRIKQDCGSKLHGYKSCNFLQRYFTRFDMDKMGKNHVHLIILKILIQTKCISGQLFPSHPQLMLRFLLLKARFTCFHSDESETFSFSYASHLQLMLRFLLLKARFTCFHSDESETFSFSYASHPQLMLRFLLLKARFTCFHSDESETFSHLHSRFIYFIKFAPG